MYKYLSDWQSHIATVGLIIFMILLIAIPATLQWLGYAFIAKKRVKFLVLYVKTILGLSILLILALIFSDKHDSEKTMNSYGPFAELSLMALFCILLFIIWSLVMAEWSRGFNLKTSAKASLFSLVLFAFPLYDYFVFLPANEIRRLKHFKTATTSVCESIDCNTNYDSVFDSKKGKSLLFQYLEKEDAGSGRIVKVFEVYKMDTFFKWQGHSLPSARRIERPMSAFMKSGHSADEEDYEVFSGFLKGKNVGTVGLDIGELVKYINSDDVYSREKRRQCFYLKEGKVDLGLKFESPSFYEYRFGIGPPSGQGSSIYTYDCDRGTPFFLQVYYDAKNHILILYKINRDCYAGP